MSDSGGYEKLTVGADGVTVTKRFEADEFPVPAIAFELTSQRDEAVRVRLRDRVPPGVAVEDLGFHPEYGSEHWTIDGETISFERELGPEAEYTTVYGIRATDTEDVEQFLTEPTVEDVVAADPQTEASQDVVPESDDVVRNIISGSGEVPGLEDEAESTDEETETLDLRDPNEPARPATDDGGANDGGATPADDRAVAATAAVPTGDGDATADGDGATVEQAETAAGVTAGSVVSAMATEIRNGDVAVDDLQLLKRAFDHVAEEGTDGTTDARVQKLQSDVADLRAYTDALESFLDEHGTAEQVVGGFEERLAEFDDELSAVQADLEDTRARTESVADTVETVQREVEDVSTDVDEVRGSVDTVTADVADVESALGGLDETVADLRADVDRLEAEVGDGDVQERVDEIESDLGDLREWKERIQQTFGG
jgi:methyl-accepting chemotaxis protein